MHQNRGQEHHNRMNAATTLCRISPIISPATKRTAKKPSVASRAIVRLLVLPWLPLIRGVVNAYDGRHDRDDKNGICDPTLPQRHDIAQPDHNRCGRGACGCEDQITKPDNDRVDESAGQRGQNIGVPGVARLVAGRDPVPVIHAQHAQEWEQNQKMPINNSGPNGPSEYQGSTRSGIWGPSPTRIIAR